jgi:hypothetical protein
MGLRLIRITSTELYCSEFFHAAIMHRDQVEWLLQGCHEFVLVVACIFICPLSHLRSPLAVLGKNVMALFMFMTLRNSLSSI